MIDLELPDGNFRAALLDPTKPTSTAAAELQVTPVSTSSSPDLFRAGVMVEAPNNRDQEVPS